jgi:hypothetical protein
MIAAVLRLPRYITTHAAAFVIGIAVGGLIVSIYVHQTYFSDDRVAYDRCLVAQSGSTIACDHLMRMRDAVRRLGQID